MSLTQPSVSHQIALLETEIGVRLLDRGRGGLRLTRAGEVLLEQADQVAWRQETFLVGMSAEHQLAGSTTPISLAKFAEDDWIVPSTERFLIQACRDAGFDPRIVAVTSDPLATRGLITRGLGVGWVAGLLIQDYAGAVIRPVKDPIRRRDIYAPLPPGARHPLARPLINALIDIAAQTHPSA